MSKGSERIKISSYTIAIYARILHHQLGDHRTRFSVISRQIIPLIVSGSPASNYDRIVTYFLGIRLYIGA